MPALRPRLARKPENAVKDTGSEAFRTAEKLAEAAVPKLADIIAIEVSELTLRGEVPQSGAPCGRTPLRRAAFRSVRGAGVRPAYAVGDVPRIPPATPFSKSLNDLCPRLVPDLNRDGRWLARDSVRARRIRTAQAHSLIVVPLAARGVVLGLVTLYRRAGSTPFGAADLKAAIRFTQGAALCLDSIARHVQERARTRLLQHVLLPEVLPSLTAFEDVASRLPAEGSGGEWFDIIPLSGARAALVVGAAHGQGTDAAVGMSRLRAMITALAVLDLWPDDILGRLDDLVIRQARELRSSGRQPSGGTYTGSSCLCAVYDPATGHCAWSRAGDAHLVIVSPDGFVTVPDLGSHPPLGIGTYPFATNEIDLPPGSVLLLETGGVHGARRGPEAIAEQLHEVFSPSGPDVHAAVEDVCRVVTGRPHGAVLVARTRVLDAESVASRTLPPDCAAVAAARAWASGQLARWMLDDLAFTTTLVVSELVTNAIRYSSGPVELRLINDHHTLTCEVSDTSGAAPHPRKAKPTDEGGRGLSIVTQLTQHHGMRHTARGKTVWTEQWLPA